jgi:ADP-ribosylglycohydrolase
MADTVGAMTGGLSAAAMGKREGSRKSVFRDLETGQE